MTERFPDWKLERYRLGELPGEELVRIGRHVADDPVLRQRLDELDADSAHFLVQFPPVHFAPRSRPTPAVAPWLRVAIPTGLALAAAVFFALRLPADPTRPSPADERPKGIPALYIHRNTPDGAVQALPDGALTHPGDLLQISYVPGGDRYGVIISIDGGGAVTTHAATGNGQSVSLNQGGATLDHAWELDEAPTFERFFLVTADTPFDVDVVVSAANQLAADPNRAAHDALSLPPGLDQHSLLLMKESR